MASEVPFTPCTLRGIISCTGATGLPRLLTGSVPRIKTYNHHCTRPVAAHVGLRKEKGQNLWTSHVATWRQKSLSSRGPRKFSREHFSDVEGDLSGIMPMK